MYTNINLAIIWCIKFHDTANANTHSITATAFPVDSNDHTNHHLSLRYGVRYVCLPHVALGDLYSESWMLHLDDHVTF